MCAHANLVYCKIHDVVYCTAPDCNVEWGNPKFVYEFGNGIAFTIPAGMAENRDPRGVRRILNHVKHA